MPLVAKIRFSSPLPQLDKEFDYLVPDELAAVLDFGFLVQVPFGLGGKEKTGVICGLTDVSSERENLLSITSVSSITSVLSREQLALCHSVAARQAGTIGELLSTAIPKRYTRIEKELGSSDNFSLELSDKPSTSTLIEHLQTNPRTYFMPELLGNLTGSGWPSEFVLAALHEFSAGRSSLVVLPDFAELARFEEALFSLGLQGISYRHASSDTGSQRHLNHLYASTKIGINYGLRSASFAPAKELGLILLWDDGDESHIEQSAPYWHSREVLLQRAELEKAKFVIASHAPSTEGVRLIEIGHLVPLKSDGPKPQSSVTELNDRLDATSFALISNALKGGNSVLVQIATAGWASSLLCVWCRKIRICSVCSSSIWIDPSGLFRCRSCKTNTAMRPCSCGKTATRPSVLGASAIAQQLERSFPEATVLHSNGENRLTNLAGGSLLVVSTPGAEPRVEGGYSVVLIADAARMVGAPRLRALEQSLGKWANAVSLARPNATVIFVGLRDSLEAKMLEFDFYGAVKDDFTDRVELALPPQTRIASVTSSNTEDHKKLILELASLLESGKTRELKVDYPNTLALDYPYSYGLELAELLSATTLKLTKSSKAKKPGERVYRINMDDSKVI